MKSLGVWIRDSGEEKGGERGGRRKGRRDFFGLTIPLVLINDKIT